MTDVSTKQLETLERLARRDNGDPDVRIQEGSRWPGQTLSALIRKGLLERDYTPTDEGYRLLASLGRWPYR